MATPRSATSVGQHIRRIGDANATCAAGLKIDRIVTDPVNRHHLQLRQPADQLRRGAELSTSSDTADVAAVLLQKCVAICRLIKLANFEFASSSTRSHSGYGPTSNISGLAIVSSMMNLSFVCCGRETDHGDADDGIGDNPFERLVDSTVTTSRSPTGSSSVASWLSRSDSGM